MINQYLQQKKIAVDAALEQRLPSPLTTPTVLHEAMRYGVLNGGKRIRPILCIAAAEACGASESQALLPALALELYHCSTLIHDDLPCMDDDDLRRGIPTCHIQFGEANALLAGDALILLAFELLAETGQPPLVRELASAAGSRGVIGGQVEDLAAEGQAPNAEQLHFIHLNKTAALIRAAARMGAVAAGATPETTEAFGQFGERIGLAFQIVDDLLDETSSTEVLGKPTGSDQIHQKMTYPSVHGLRAAQTEAARLTDEALMILRATPCKIEMLAAIARRLVDRIC